MLVRNLVESEKELRVFRAEIKDIVELCNGVTRMLLMDSEGDLIYCLLEGIYWTEKAMSLQQGDKTLVGPSKIMKIPECYEAFYAPSIPGKSISPYFVHYPPEDSGLRLELEKSLPLKSVLNPFRSLADCLNIAHANTLYKVSIIGVVLDCVVEETHPEDTLCKIKLTDESLYPEEFLQVHFFIPTGQTPQITEIGNILVAQGLTFKCFEGRPQGVYNRFSNGAGIFSSNLEMIWASPHFFMNEEIKERVLSIENWELEEMRKWNIQTGKTLSNLGKAKQFRFEYMDVICYVVEKVVNFPEPSESTLLLCDDTGYMLLQCFSFKVDHIETDEWVKIRETKIMETSLVLSPHSSVFRMPEWSYNVEEHLKDSIPGIQIMCKEAKRWFEHIENQIRGNEERIVSETNCPELPLTSVASILNPYDNTEFLRIKALGIDVHPREFVKGLVEVEDGWEFKGLFLIWSCDEVLEVVVSGWEGAEFLGIRGIKTRERVEEILENEFEVLLSGNSWVELALRRVLLDGRIFLKLVMTRIKN